MNSEAPTPFGTLAPWQAMLDRNAELFAELEPGAAVGFVPRAGSGLQPGKHVGALALAGGSGCMLVWTKSAHGMCAGLRGYTGFEGIAVDLLFVVEEAGIDALRAALDVDTLSLVKRLIRQGAIMFYVMRNKYELQDAGYEDFLDTLGLAFLGACR